MVLPPQKKQSSQAAPARAIALCLALAVALGTHAAQANDLLVRYDQSQLIRLPRPAAEVIIGNPSIADVAIQGGNMLVVTGKSFGVTNIIALDAERNVIQDQKVLVERDAYSTLVLHKGAERETYTCTPSCSPTLSIGDKKEYFDAISKHSQTKANTATNSAERGGQASTE